MIKFYLKLLYDKIKDELNTEAILTILVIAIFSSYFLFKYITFPLLTILFIYLGYKYFLND